MFGRTVVAGILTAAVACDKQVKSAPAVKATSLAGKPTALFLLFGDRADPRLLPVATVTGSRITPITLDGEGWHSFDKLYFTPGESVHIYRDGVALAPATVRRGMWTEAEPLYTLPGCESLRPLGAVTLPPDPAAGGIGIAMLDASISTVAPARIPAVPADVDSARAFAERAAQRAGFTKSTRDELELLPLAIRTGATDRPTLIVSYAEKGMAGTGRHVFALGDVGVDGYATTFVHVAADSAPEFRRLVDHVDITGDGVDELLLEGWRRQGESFLVVMQFTGGRWREVARGTNSWCADVKKKA
jgi:hypothetical protein